MKALTPETKECNRCKLPKTASQFYFHEAKCKTCKEEIKQERLSKILESPTAKFYDKKRDIHYIGF